MTNDEIQMNKILLLEGPDGNKYKGTLLQRGIWSVSTFANMRSSIWWMTERQGYYYNWNSDMSYTDEKLKETFIILAESETYIHPSNFIIHDAY
jgi:hypothetical protein